MDICLKFMLITFVLWMPRLNLGPSIRLLFTRRSIASLCKVAFASTLRRIMMYGPSRRVADFLLSRMQPVTEERYRQALQSFRSYCDALALDFWP